MIAIALPAINAPGRNPPAEEPINGPFLGSVVSGNSRVRFIVNPISAALTYGIFYRRRVLRILIASKPPAPNINHRQPIHADKKIGPRISTANASTTRTVMILLRMGHLPNEYDRMRVIRHQLVEHVVGDGWPVVGVQLVIDQPGSVVSVQCDRDRAIGAVFVSEYVGFHVLISGA